MFLKREKRPETDDFALKKYLVVKEKCLLFHIYFIKFTSVSIDPLSSKILKQGRSSSIGAKM